MFDRDKTAIQKLSTFIVGFQRPKKVDKVMYILSGIFHTLRRLRSALSSLTIHLLSHAADVYCV